MEDCGNPSRARGLCTRHYARWRRHGTTELTAECRRCGVVLTKYGERGPWPQFCVPCRRAHESDRVLRSYHANNGRERQAERKAAEPERFKAYQRRYLLRTYGLTEAEWRTLLDSQHGCCAICKTPADQLHVDHDHLSGAVRALLCRRCNTGLGMFDDDEGRLLAAVAYLRRNRRTVVSPSELGTGAQQVAVGAAVAGS